MTKGIVIVGPTASGKSQLAIDIATIVKGSIINADSLQLYKELRILTSRPSDDDLVKIPHYLYGCFDGNYNSTAFKWLKLAIDNIKNVLSAKRIPILVGGTGLYIKTLVEGISNIPELPFEVKEKARNLFTELGRDNFLNMLKKRDEDFKATDPQRMIRAWEVLEGTGKPLSFWQSQGLRKEFDGEWLVIYINPPRPVLYEQCEARLDLMIELGAIDEVKNLIQMNLEPSLSVMKAIGVREISDYLRGMISLESATALSKQATKNYAKRQVTWFSHQIHPDIVIDNNDTNKIIDGIESFLAN